MVFDIASFYPKSGRPLFGMMLRARWLRIKSAPRPILLIESDLVGRPVPLSPDHALRLRAGGQEPNAPGGAREGLRSNPGAKRCKTKIAKSARGPSQRSLRVGELVRHALAEMLARGEVRDPSSRTIRSRPGGAHVARHAPRHRLCDAARRQGSRPVLEALERNQRFIKGEIARRINLRYARISASAATRPSRKPRASMRSCIPRRSAATSCRQPKRR